MTFNSFHFAIFLPVVFALYWLLNRHLRWQNALVLAASYVFYGWWDWRFLLLIAFTSFCSYISGIKLSGGNYSPKSRKVWLWANISVNLAILAVFKYYDFFVAEAAQLLHLDSSSLLLQLALPVGISFYTFQALSYSIDVYKGKIEPTRDAVAFFAYISFFPQLVAGPIERATNLLPQFLQRRTFDYHQAVDGARQILWGLFKKMVVADNCAFYVNDVFHVGGDPFQRVMAAILFAFQIYGDFSGYSDVAIGTAKLFGIRLMQNFRTPYFSRDIAEFWRRWHISLTTWFRDYIYIPLGGSRVKRWKVARNTFVIFLLSGLWHGANWTFIAWGLYHACLFLPLILLGRNRKHTGTVAEGRLLPSWKEVLQMLLNFTLVAIGWVFFHATGIPSALAFLTSKMPHSVLPESGNAFPTIGFVAIAVLLVVEWLNRSNDHGLYGTERLRPLQNIYTRCVLFAVFFVLILFFRGGTTPFIYFQF